jgi:hypothetical protein
MPPAERRALIGGFGSEAIEHATNDSRAATVWFVDAGRSCTACPHPLAAVNGHGRNRRLF